MDSAIVVKNFFDPDDNYLNSMRTKFSTTQERFSASHKNIVEIKFWDMNQDPATRLYNLYFFMEKMKDNLCDIIKERQKMNMFFTEQEMKKLVGDTFAGMEAIQNKRIAHMNLKPTNILVDFDEVYKIADIGHPNDMSLPQFVSPELGTLGNMSTYYESSNNGREETFRADAFSYGAILFQAASLCDISEVDALKVVSTSATKFVKDKFAEIAKKYGDLWKIIRDLTAHHDRKNFKQIEDLISLYLTSSNSQVFSDGPIAQSQFVSQLIPQQDEQAILKDLLEEIYSQRDINVRQELSNVAIYNSNLVNVNYFEQIMNKALKGKLKRDELGLLVRYYDSGKGDNTIDYVKFCDNMEAPYKRKETTVQDLMKQFYQSFRLHFNTFEEFIIKYDANRNGIFDFIEIKNIYKQWFPNFDSESFSTLFKSLNPNKQNQVYFTTLQQAFQPFISEDLSQIIKQIADAFERQQSTFEQFIQKNATGGKWITESNFLIGMQKANAINNQKDFKFLLSSLKIEPNHAQQYDLPDFLSKLLQKCSSLHVPLNSHQLNFTLAQSQSSVYSKKFQEQQQQQDWEKQSQRLGSRTPGEQQFQEIKRMLASMDKATILGLFEYHDKDNDQKLSLDQFIRYLKQFKASLEEYDIRNAFGYLDTNKDNKVSLTEFIIKINPDWIQQEKQEISTGNAMFDKQNFIECEILIHKINQSLQNRNQQPEQYFDCVDKRMSLYEFEQRINGLVGISDTALEFIKQRFISKLKFPTSQYSVNIDLLLQCLKSFARYDDVQNNFISSILFQQLQHGKKPALKKTHEFNIILKQIVLTMQNKKQNLGIFCQSNPSAIYIPIQEFRNVLINNLQLPTQNLDQFIDYFVENNSISMAKFQQEWENTKQVLQILRQLRQPILDLNLDTIFHAYDLNKDNWLDFQEFSKLVKKISPTVTTDQIQILFSMFDENNDNRISLEEFKLALEIQQSQFEPQIQSFFKELSMALNSQNQQFETIFQQFVYQNNLPVENFRSSVDRLGINTTYNQQELQLPNDTQILDYPLLRYYYNKYKIIIERTLSPQEQQIVQSVSAQIQGTMNKHNWTFEQAFGKYDPKLSGFITIPDLHNALINNLGMPASDMQIQAFEGMMGDEKGKVNLQKLKQNIMQSQSGNGQNSLALEKFKQQIQKQYNSQEDVLQYFMGGWERVPQEQFCQKVTQQNLLNQFEAKDVAALLDKNNSGFISANELKLYVLSQIQLSSYNKSALAGVKQIESPRNSVSQFQQKKSQDQFGNQYNSIYQQQQQPSQYPQQQPNEYPSQYPAQQQQQQSQWPQQYPQQPQQPLQQYPQQPQQPLQQYPQQPQQQYPQQPQQQYPQQPQQYPLQSQIPQIQSVYQEQVPPYNQNYPQQQNNMAWQQNQPQQYPQQQQNNISWQQNQPQQLPLNSQLPQQSFIQQGNPNDLTQYKLLIDSLADHAYELKILLKDKEVSEYSIQMEVQKLEGKQFVTVQEIKHLAEVTKSLKPNDSINLDKLLDNCKLILEKNYKIDKEQFNQDTMITELKEKINNYIKGQQISFRTFFRQIALNNDQQMEHKEFQVGIKKKLGITLDDRQTIQLFKQIDKNGDFQLSYEEFQHFMQGEDKLEIKPILRKIRKKILRKDGEDLREIFNKIDINKDKKINFQEWQSAMTSLDLELTFDEITALFKHFDKSGTDGINYEHFETIMLEDHMSLKQWVKQIEGYCMMNSLTQENFFRRFNQQGKDLMSFKEFKSLLQAVDANAVKEFDNDQYEDIFNIFDQDKDYQISLMEFQKLLNLQKNKGQLTESTTQVITKLLQRIRRKAMNQRANLYWELKQYDYNNYNKVKFEDWSRVIKRFCDLAPSELEILFKNFDKEDTNSIDINEFISQIQNTHQTADISTLIDKMTEFSKKFNLSIDGFWNKFNKSPGQNWKFEEFNKMMESLHFQCQQEEKDEYFQNFDLDNDNQISLPDLQQAMRKNFRMKMNFDMYANPYQNQVYQQPYQPQVPPQLPIYSQQQEYQQSQIPPQLPIYSQQQEYQQSQLPIYSQQQEYQQSQLLLQEQNKFKQSQLQPQPFENILPIAAQTQYTDQFALSQAYEPPNPMMLQQEAPSQANYPQQLASTIKRDILNSYRSSQMTDNQLFEIFFNADQSKQFTYTTLNELKVVLSRLKINRPEQDISAFYKFYSREFNQVNYLKVYSDLLTSEIALRMAMLKIIEFQKINEEKLFKNISSGNNFMTYDQFYNFSEKIKMELTRSEASVIFQQYQSKQNGKFSLTEFRMFLSMGGANQGLASQYQNQMFEENMFLDERPILTLIAKEMQQNKNILTVADLFKTKDKQVPKISYFNSIVWLGFNQNDPQILSLAKKLSYLPDSTKIQADWFEEALRRLGNLGQHMQQKFGSGGKQKADFNWEEQNFLNQLTDDMKDTADEIADAVVEDNVGMFAFKKYDKEGKDRITQRQFDQIIYADLHFQKDQYLDGFIRTMCKNNFVDLKLLEKVLNNKGTLSKFQQNQNKPSTEMYGIGRFEQTPSKKLTPQQIQQAQQLVEIIKKRCKNEEQINEYFFPLGSPSAINLKVFMDKMAGIKGQVNMKESDTELLFNYLDASSNGILTASEFKLIFETQHTKKNINNIKISGRLQDEIRSLFQKLDSNNNNTLDQSEISEALQSIGICPNPTELQEYFRKIDLDHNGVIDYTEFSTFMVQKLREEMLSIEEFQSNIRREFKKVDVNKTRLLTRSQMDTLFRNLGYELDKQELEVLFQEIDKDQSGLLDIDELLYFLSSTKQDISETAKMAILNINCAHISLSDLAATFKQLPPTCVNSFLRRLNKQGQNLPSCQLKLQLDNTKLYYKDLVYDMPPGMQQFIPGAQQIGKPVLRRIIETEWFEIKLNQLTGVPLPEKKNLILGREVKFCLMDSINNFIGNTAKMKAYWTQQYEDRWYFSPQGMAPQTVPFFETPLKEENQLIVRIHNSQLDKITKLIMELIIYVKNSDKVIAVSCGWVEIVIKELINQNKTSFELPIQSGIPANSKTLSNIKAERKGWSKFVQKLKSPIKSQVIFEISKQVKFPPDYKDLVNCLPSTIILNKVHLNYFAIYREYIAVKCLDPQYNRTSLNLHKSPKVRAFILGINSMDFVELVTRFWLKLESGQQFRNLAKQSEELFKLKIKCFENIQDQAYLLMNNLAFKYNYSDPTYPAHYDVIARNRNSLYNDFMSSVTMRLNPQRSGQVPVKKEWYSNLEPFNTAQLSDDEDDNILLQKFKTSVQKGKQKARMAQTYQGQYGQNQQQQQGQLKQNQQQYGEQFIEEQYIQHQQPRSGGQGQLKQNQQQYGEQFIEDQYIQQQQPRSGGQLAQTGGFVQQQQFY